MESFDIGLKLLEEIYQIYISDDLCEKIKAIFIERRLSKHEVLIQIGEKHKKIHFVISGVLRDYYIDQNGNDMTRFFIQQGGICGAEELLLNEASSVCTEALEACVLLSCSSDAFKKLITEENEFSKIWVKCLEISLIYKIKRENSFLTKNATERYLDFKREHSFLEENVPQKHIASYLGITPVSLSRIRKTMKE